MSIHPTAIVDPAATLADDVVIEAYTIVGPHLRIGAGTVVGPHCVLDGRTEIGSGNRFYSGSQIGVLTQDLKHDPARVGRCQIGNGNVFREHVVISSSTLAPDDDDNRATTIGNACMFMCNTHIGHDCHLGDNVVVATGTGFSGHVDMDDNAIVGGLTGFHQDVRVGKYSFTGGLSRVVKDVPPFMLAGEVPCRVHGPNTVGLQRNGFDADARKRVKELYRILYRSNLNVSQAVAEIERSVEPSDERTAILEFIAESKRGITP